MLLKKIIMGLVLLATAMTLATTGAFANAPGGAYIQCDGGPSSPADARPTVGKRLDALPPFECDSTAEVFLYCRHEGPLDDL
jgi:hypothetical protein